MGNHTRRCASLRCDGCVGRSYVAASFATNSIAEKVVYGDKQEKVNAIWVRLEMKKPVEVMARQ